MFRNIIGKIIKDPSQKEIENLTPLVERVNELEPALKALSSEDLKNRIQEFREQVTASISDSRSELAALRLERDSSDGDEKLRLDVEVEEMEKSLLKLEKTALAGIQAEVFAIVREAAVRTIGLRHYDVQVVGGALLHEGRIVEMKTGEGKTLVATMPLVLNSLLGNGAHLVTVNDYLAKRDGGWMGRLYHLLGLSVGVITPYFSAVYDPNYIDPDASQVDERLVHWRPCSRRQAYTADITYGTNNEFGFDYLRDNIARDDESLVQRELYYAIVDEVDNAFIDEARTPLIISGPAEEASDQYVRFAGLVRGLRRNTAPKGEPPKGEVDIEEKTRTVTLNERGLDRIESMLPEVDVEAGESLYDVQHNRLAHYLENALKAEFIFRRDKDYVVQEGEVIIVDEQTGRLMRGRRYSEGLHQAIEAKEGLAVQRESVTVATVTFQNFYRLYRRLAGMTGTAETEAEEFNKIYKVDVTVLPTNVEYRVMQGELQEDKHKEDGVEVVFYVDPDGDEVYQKRVDYADVIYRTEDGKFRAIVDEIRNNVELGRPVLVGTIAVETSERLSDYLKRASISHEVLNAKRHTEEAAIIAQAGQPGAVTISTNMAGRGVDILLGGNPEFTAARVVEKSTFDFESIRNLCEMALDERNHPGEIDRYVKGNRRLDVGMVDVIRRFAGNLEKLRDNGAAFLSTMQLQNERGLDWSVALQIVNLVGQGTLGAAREVLSEQGLTPDVVFEVERSLSYHRAKEVALGNSPLPDVVANEVYAWHYNNRMRFMRAVLADDFAEIEAVTREVPAIPTDLADKIRDVRSRWREDKRAVIEAGGLYVVGTERHESRRIDNQLRGRAGRQGDPGASRFFISMEDELMRRFGGSRAAGLMERISEEDDMPIEMGIIGKTIEGAQHRVEGYNFDIRKHLLEYDDVVSSQRLMIYEQRGRLLKGKGGVVESQLKEYYYNEIEELLDRYLEHYEEWMMSEARSLIYDMSNPVDDSVNARAVVRRLARTLPQVAAIEQNGGLPGTTNDLEMEIAEIVEQSAEEGHNLNLLFGSLSTVIPDVNPSPPHPQHIANRPPQERQWYISDYMARADKALLQLSGEEPGDWEGSPEREEFTRRANAAFMRQSRGDNSYFAMVAVAFQEMALGLIARQTHDALRDTLFDAVDDIFARYREQVGEEDFEMFIRWFLLAAIDREWTFYLTAIDDLRQGIGLQAYAQQDPLVQFKRHSYEMFAELQTRIGQRVVYDFFRQLPRHKQFVEAQRERQQRAKMLSRLNLQEDQKGTLRRASRKIGRNDPCPCGSGKKYKDCHGRRGGGAPAAASEPTGSSAPQQQAKARQKKRKKKRR